SDEIARGDRERDRLEGLNLRGASVVDLLDADSFDLWRMPWFGLVLSRPVSRTDHHAPTNLRYGANRCSAASHWASVKLADPTKRLVNSVSTFGRCAPLGAMNSMTRSV